MSAHSSLKRPPIYLSNPSAVSMGAEWFELANPRHFWFLRRWQVLAYIAKKCCLSLSKSDVVEIGCGNGVLLSQLSDRLGCVADGFELNEEAIRISIAQHNQIYYYNIEERNDKFAALYDIAFMFDIIEHIGTEKPFLKSVAFHLKSDGLAFVNVPAHPFLYSHYDRAAGHFRRYTIRSLDRVMISAGFKPVYRTYWGLGLIPLVIARNIADSVLNSKSKSSILRRGFHVPSKSINSLLRIYSEIDPLPNCVCGSSVMGLYQKLQS